MSGLNIRVEGEAAEQLRARPLVDTFWLWPDNLDTWDVFMACSTQWRWSVHGRSVALGVTSIESRREGLDYVAVETVLRPSGMDRQRQRLAREEIRLMEHACLEVWRKERHVRS